LRGNETGEKNPLSAHHAQQTRVGTVHIHVNRKNRWVLPSKTIARKRGKGEHLENLPYLLFYPWMVKQIKTEGKRRDILGR